MTILINASFILGIVYVLLSFIHDYIYFYHSNSIDEIFGLSGLLAWGGLPLTGLWVYRRLRAFQKNHFLVYMVLSTVAVFIFESLYTIDTLLYSGDDLTGRFEYFSLLLVYGLFLLPLFIAVVSLLRRKLSVRRFLVKLSVALGVVLALVVISVLGGDRTQTLLEPLHRPFNGEHPEMREALLNIPLLTVTSRYDDVLSCYARQRPISTFDRLVSRLFGELIAAKTPHITYYQNAHCMVVYVQSVSTVGDLKAFQERAVLAELLIRRHYGQHIMLRREMRPSRSVRLLDPERAQKHGRLEGYFDPQTFSISAFRRGPESWQAPPLNVLLHEELHAFSSPTFRSLSEHKKSSLDEAITQYLTEDITHSMFREVKSRSLSYKPQMEALMALLPFIDRFRLLDIYFNGDLSTLVLDVDTRLYPGALCSFDYYLDESLQVYIEGKLMESIKLADRAVETLTNRALAVPQNTCRES